MLNSVELDNFGPLRHIRWGKLSNINLIIGANSSGKTFLLKSLYCSMRTLEEYQRGNDQRSAAEILADKLYWTFQADKIGDLVTKNSDGPLSSRVMVDSREFRYSFGRDTTKNIASLENHVPPRESNSIFLPPKEVLSLQSIILKSRDVDKEFGFDDTYYDLARALRITPTKGKNHAHFAKARESLEDMFDGKVEFDSKTSRWQFKKGNQKFPIGATAEGVKKIAILDTLLGNRYLSKDSVVFIDEPESALHPVAISRLIEIIVSLAASGIQFFIASHSYFVVKALYVAAQKQQMPVPVLSFIKDHWVANDLLSGMPDNPIIDESIRLYEEEVELALG
ncbi:MULTISPECIES: AAA family ATPase [unclassified Pseudomonas]|uniref:AAA family ATPase n=1 Tax=unclassified Pseudomonas TaxID=196821 RepID=UPI00119B2AFD|nr:MULTISPECIES: ATP-binding protein [unclassified Pseudomonas]TWC06692.1 putative ATPase [Pseudomonas sp. SJZ075]TWC20906.1 putative ATPase [Pseudomonas sp. SJZ074]TWC26831.1 putative ATPase [Pseudomonas sp. SJZ078]TWC38431.1 putative ATPase [Pseudomonas sp. SJZ085]TWC45477.1 putative ATPase [Pseudomonas sp. SJZ124]